MSLSRRSFLKAAGAYSLGFAGLNQLLARHANATPPSPAKSAGFGPLREDPAGVLDLPEGFSYRVISRVGDPMSDGFRVPGKPDGMATFAAPGGKTVIVRNHELSPDDWEASAWVGSSPKALELRAESVFDWAGGETPCPGGTTTLLFDTKSGRLEGQRLSLAGTVRNCAGGPTPWGTWVTCEESVVRAGKSKDSGGLQLEKDHGYPFEVPGTYEGGLTEAVALRAMGRFNHEAVAVDPASGIVYQTEDRGDGLIYRYVPDVPGNLARGGRLQALRVRDRAGLDTRNWKEPLVARGDRLAVEWVDLNDVHAPDDDLRYRGHAEQGAALFARGEGMWTGTDGIYFACTNGGRSKKGQIWRYLSSKVEGQPGEAVQPGVLELFVEPNDGGLVDNADNLTVAPWGDLVVCEDGSGAQFLVGITPKGGIYKFAHNAVSSSEFAGATFAPDGSTLFVNIQHAGLTLAIRGPWDRARPQA